MADFPIQVKITSNEATLSSIMEFMQSQSEGPVRTGESLDEGDTLNFDPTLGDLAAILAVVRSGVWLASAPKYLFNYIRGAARENPKVMMTIKTPKGMVKLEAVMNLVLEN
ncbi:hypothetical protein [Roseomonas marmotae]|uniref:Uncharacterized protein n=1 Tax=Roseomonas marmotae TaxID=2768161 RepID=A0ABS3KK61_9PROT|nr:hypothetical protein [Roseomonas marmotae]MBO1077387.1 hypothetical protein [Roseomonas marmotae]QTI79548.1 hypothetical protein IAI58_01615 [Roseomonas marmotae]